MDALGRIFNVTPTADAAWVALKEASAVTFVCVGADAETFTLQEAQNSGGTGAASLLTLARYSKNSGAVGATAWVRDNAPTTAAVVTTATAYPVAVFTVHQSELSDGFTHVRVSSSASGTVVAFVHDLIVARAPENLSTVKG